MSERIRSNPRLFTLAIGLLAGAAVWALLPREAEAAQPNTKDLVLKLQDEVFQLGLKVEQIPPNWLPPADRVRFELVLPQQGPSGADYEGVLDHRTGLVWQRRPDNWVDNFRNMQRRAHACQTGGVMGWRIPFAHELMTLAQVTREGEFKLHEDFPLETPASVVPFWTQTEQRSPEGYAGTYYTTIAFSNPIVGLPLDSWSEQFSVQAWLVMGPGAARH